MPNLNKKKPNKTKNHQKPTQNPKIYVMVISPWLSMVFLLLFVDFSLLSPPFPCPLKEVDYSASRMRKSISPPAILGSGHQIYLWGFKQKPVPSQAQGVEQEGHSTADGHIGKNYNTSLTAGQTKLGLSTVVIFWSSNAAALL